MRLRSRIGIRFLIFPMVVTAAVAATSWMVSDQNGDALRIKYKSMLCALAACGGRRSSCVYPSLNSVVRYCLLGNPGAWRAGTLPVWNRQL
jgi:hypothetical protein